MAKDLILPSKNALSPSEEKLASYIRQSQADNSLRAYRADMEHFRKWGGKVPASPEIVAGYLADHASALSLATLRRRLASISKAHRLKECASPVQTEIVRLAIRGIARAHGKPQRQIAPLLKEDLLHVLSLMGTGHKGVRDRALLLIGFAGAFRRSELVAINCTDLEITDRGLLVTITRSKTDQLGEGRKVAIPYARGTVCPVGALRDWLSVAGISEGAAFRSVSKSGRIGTCALSTRAVASVIKERMEAAGYDPADFSGHSLRAGLATSAAIEGVPTRKIKAQTGHKSDAMLGRYIRDADIFTENAAGLLF